MQTHSKTRMRHFLNSSRYLRIIVLVALVACRAEHQNPFANNPEDSSNQAARDFYIVITSLPPPAEPIPEDYAATADQELIFKVFTERDGDVRLEWPIALEYRCAVRLVDAAGREVPKRWGNRLGRSFGRLRHYWDTRMVSLYAFSGGYQGPESMSSGAGRLPPAKRLFRIKQPGRYELQLRVQVFIRESDEVRLLRLPVASLTVEYEIQSDE